MKTVVTGLQPSGSLTLGNYLGAIKNFIKLQNELEDTRFYMMIADLHAITVNHDRLALRKHIKELAATLLACGLDEEKTILFIQSEVPAHNQLGYIMESTVYIGEIERMIQYKQKKRLQAEGIRTSLLTYPALMAADVLLYDADFVPIGDDQRQHLELTRLLAERFNNRYGETFTVPKPFYGNSSVRIMSLSDPSKKMSKSDENQKSYILLLDDLNQVKNKIKAAVTDSEAAIYYDPKKKPGISNLIEIYASLKDLKIEAAEAELKALTYQEFKELLANLVITTLEPIQKKYHELINSQKLDDILDQGRNLANTVAFKKLAKVYQKVGLGRKRR